MTTNNLNSKLIALELSVLLDYLRGKELKEPYSIVLHLDKRTLTKKERETYAPRCLETYYTNIINSISMQPNVSKFTLYYTARSRHGTFVAEGKRSNLSVTFTVATTDKGSKYFYSTYRVEFKDKESLLIGLQVYTALVIQSKDKIMRSKLKSYFSQLNLL